MSKTLVQLKDERALLEGKLSTRKGELLTLAKTETRKLTDAEEGELTQIVDEIRAIDADIAIAEARGKAPIIKTSTKSVSRNLAMEAIRGIVSGNMSEEAAAFIEKGQADMRNVGIEAEGNLIIPMQFRGDVVQATVAGSGKEAISEDLQDLIGPLRERLVMVQAGASFLTGLKGNVGLPFYSGSTATWEGEIAAAKSGKGDFSKKVISPKRITTTISVSKQFIAQDTTSSWPLLQRDIVDAVAIKLQSTILGGHAHATTMPDGFFTGTPEFVTSGAANYEGVIDLEAAIDTSNALSGNLAYITSAKGKAALKKTLKAAGVAEGFILENGTTLNGYKFLSTNGIASGLGDDADEDGIIFGNWAELIIGQWGGLDLTVDPYTKAGDGQIRLVINAFFDAIQRRPDAFAVGTLK